MPPRENDPLLPHPSPPPTTNVYYFKEIPLDEKDAPSRRYAHEASTVLVLCVIFSFIFIFYPRSPAHEDQPVPTTLEERVERILTDTPLIGKRYLASPSTHQVNPP
jgi:hypothetical protein